jgi:hypothetical protein
MIYFCGKDTFFFLISKKNYQLSFPPHIFLLRSRSLAYNGMAAWRSGGIYALPFKFALPAAVAPNRSLGDGILPRMLSL